MEQARRAGRGHRHRGRPDRAVLHESGDQVSAAGGSDVEIGSLMARGRGLLDAGKYGDAVRCLQSAVHRRPEFPDLHNLLGLALSMAGEPLRAESHLARALELNPDYAEAHLNLAILLFERNAYGAARDHLRDFTRIVRGGSSALPEPALDDLARRHAELAE